MIRVKRKVNKKIIISLILLVAFAVLLTSSILLDLIETDEGSKGNKRELLEMLEGEAIYNGYNLAYPYVADGMIDHISVYDKTNTFKLIRPDEKGDMVLYYKDKNGTITPYYPNIFATDENIDYSSLYAIEQGDGLGMVPLVSYLCSAVGYTAFQERIALSDDPEIRAAQLVSFGFGADEIISVQFDYRLPTEESEEKTDAAEGEGSDAEEAEETEEPKTESHTIKIGKKNITGYGRYFMVDDRDYIYCAATNYLDYGVQGFVSFIKPYLVTEGMAGDNSVLAAYLTQDFKEWKNTVHNNLGDIVEADSQVVVEAQAVVPRLPGAKFEAELGDSEDGYRYGSFEQLAYYLDNLKKDPQYNRLVNTLTGLQVGQYYDHLDPNANVADAPFFTLISQSKNIDFEENSSVTYEYSIVEIESILTDDGEITEKGVRVGDRTLIKVTYETKINGEEVANFYEHAVIDLSDERIPEKTRRTLSVSSIGRLSKAVSFSYEYTTETAVRYDVEYVICDILEVYDKDGKETSEITADSQVVYRYYLVADGVRDEDVHVGTLRSVDEDDDAKSVRAALLGKSISYNVEIPTMTYTEYSELLYDFMTYRVSSVEYFVTSELVTAFGFVNVSDRNPFFGESVYQNKLGDENKLYGINADVCAEVLNYFMGVTDNSGSSTNASGLVGTKTVAIGLTPENMEKYGLYAYTIYIELPRGIVEIKDENYYDDNKIPNWGWRDTLSFYLFISEEQPDGTRYIASDMYDLVATIDSKIFDFLDYDFVEFWARRNLLITDVKNVDNVKLELNMNDVYGKYNFDLTHETIYIDANGKIYLEQQADIETDVYHLSHIDTTQYGDCVETAFSKFLADKGLETTSLAVLYNHLYGDGDKMVMGNRDALGSANFKNLMNMIFYVSYTGVVDDLTKEERDEIAKGTPLMSLSISLSSQAYSYTYEFHKLDDRRVMVTLYQSDPQGNKVGKGVSDFYISTFAFKKIVSGFIDVLDGNTVDADTGYSDNR